MTIARKTRVFWPLLFVVLLSDCTTKHVAVEALGSPGVSHEVLGETVRFTLVYNRGAAMGLVGPWAKELLGVVGVLAAVLLFRWYRKAAPDAVAFGAATALLIAGALGNAWQRILDPRGVVDFVDVGVGANRFWIFNAADVAVNVGAILLLLVLLRGYGPAESTTSPGR